MQTILPGEPQAELQAVSTVLWQGIRLVVYVSGNSIVILGGPQQLLQTIYVDHCDRLSAVVVDPCSGKIAACGGRIVSVYRPYGKAEGALKWSLALDIAIPEEKTHVKTLSWGSEEELLIGSSSLMLFSTAEQGHLIWRCSLPGAAKIATFSPDASLVASTSWRDTLIKLWRRQSFGSSDTRFDLTYLPHPATISAIQWRTPPTHNHRHSEPMIDDVLFSVCVDGKIRIWAALDPHGLSYMQLWAEINMYESLQPRNFTVDNLDPSRYAFFINSQDFSDAVARVTDTGQRDANHEVHLFDHLIDVAKTTPDICVVLDAYANMSAWGIRNIGCKAGKGEELFNIVHISDFNLSPVMGNCSSIPNACFSIFINQKPNPELTILSNMFNGQITWHETRADVLFDPSPRPDRLCSKALWTGHEEPVTNLLREVTGESILSCTAAHEAIIWKRHFQQGKMLLARQSTICPSQEFQSACLLPHGDFAMILQTEMVQLWDTRTSTAVFLAESHSTMRPPFMSLFSFSKEKSGSSVHYLIALTSKMAGDVWKVVLPPSDRSRSSHDNDQPASVTHVCNFQVETHEDMRFVRPIDTLPYASSGPGSVKALSKIHAYSVSDAGTAFIWRIDVDEQGTAIKWRATSTIRTDIQEPSHASVSSTRKLSIADSSRLRLTIWDAASSRKEYDENFSLLDKIQNLEWSATSDTQVILAVGFPHKVKVLTQSRYNYLSEGPAWISLKEISTKELTSHPISDMVWLSRGNLAIAAGNQMYVCSNEVPLNDAIVDYLGWPARRQVGVDILDLVSALNGPLPVFHPQVLDQCVLMGSLSRAEMIVLALSKALKYFVAGDDLDSHLGLSLEAFFWSQRQEIRESHQHDSSEGDEFDQESIDQIAANLKETLRAMTLPYISSGEQLRLVETIDSFALMSQRKSSMDYNAVRYCFSLSQHMLQRDRSQDKSGLTWREIVWAIYSGSQDILIDYVSRQFRGRLLWQDARESGMFLWITDRDALHAQFELIARNEYTKSEDKNPTDCSLYYIALKKKNVLLGLWRMATWNREQAGTLRLLKNNFAESRWKIAASKNAYALLGKRRFEYAAAWFLLSGNLQDAVNVCAHQMKDLQLAIAVARVYEGDDGPVLRSLLKQTVLPQAAINGNRWQATWAFWFLGQREMAIKALMEPLQELLPISGSPQDEAQSYRNDDPTLLVLYRQLRDGRLGTHGQPPNISPKAEWDLVMRTVRQYNRMGCHLLALDVVRNWRFASPSPKPFSERPSTGPRRKSTRRRSAASVSTPKSPNKERPKPTMIKEPDSSSLLDSFGF